MPWLLIPVALVLAAVLYGTGLLSSSAAVSTGGNWGGPTWWQGRYALLSGRLRRCLTTAGCDCLLIQVETLNGSLCLEIRDGSGELRYAWYDPGTLSVQTDIRGMDRCTVRITAHQFQGSFSLTVQ